MFCLCPVASIFLLFSCPFILNVLAEGDAAGVQGQQGHTKNRGFRPQGRRDTEGYESNHAHPYQVRSYLVCFVPLRSQKKSARVFDKV